MSQERKLVIVISQGLDNERSSVAWSIANGSINEGLDVSIFLVSSGTDWARKGAADKIRQNPEDPTLGEMIRSVIDRGYKIGVCPPCASMRGYDPEDLIEGVEIIGPPAITDPVKQGAAILSF